MRAGRIVEDGIDLAWLRRRAEADPLPHAFALWDSLVYPDRVRFTMLRNGSEVEGYLLIWHGHSAYPVVHWVGAEHGSSELAEVLPVRPLVAVVPPGCVADVERRRGPIQSYRLRLLRHRRGEVLHAPNVGAPRRLALEDAGSLRALTDSSTDLVASGYSGVDLGHSHVVGAFSAGRLVAVARAQVELDRIWILGGVYTNPSDRGHGYGASVTGWLTKGAHAAGADAALYVRTDNLSALRAYERLGYSLVDEKVWLDAGANVLP